MRIDVIGYQARQVLATGPRTLNLIQFRLPKYSEKAVFIFNVFISRFLAGEIRNYSRQGEIFAGYSRCFPEASEFSCERRAQGVP